METAPPSQAPHPEVRAEGEPRRTQPCRCSAQPPLRASRFVASLLAPQHEEIGDAPTIFSPEPGAWLSSGRWFMATVAPHCANSSTAASPMPDEPPVTRTVLLARSALIICSPSHNRNSGPSSQVLILRCEPKASLEGRNPADPAPRRRCGLRGSLRPP